MLSLVGLNGFKNAYPSELSGGMKQRVAVARVLAVDPTVLLMDEPFGSVDVQTRTALRANLLDIRSETGKTVIFVTDEILEAVLLADRVVVMGGHPRDESSQCWGPISNDRDRETTIKSLISSNGSGRPSPISGCSDRCVTL